MKEYGEGEQMPAVAEAASARRSRGKRQQERMWARAGRRVREPVPLAAAAKARSALTMAQQRLREEAAVGRAGAGGAAEAAWGALVGQAAAVRRRSRGKLYRWHWLFFSRTSWAWHERSCINDTRSIKIRHVLV